MTLQGVLDGKSHLQTSKGIIGTPLCSLNVQIKPAPFFLMAVLLLGLHKESVARRSSQYDVIGKVASCFELKPSQKK